jgi:hypothetical protein
MVLSIPEVSKLERDHRSKVFQQYKTLAENILTNVYLACTIMLVLL